MLAKIRTLSIAAGLAVSALAPLQASKAHAGAEPFIGEIMLVGYTFCPRNYAEAAGQLLPINEYTALFSLYGTTYGGDGRTTFALPDLRGRTPVSHGQGPGLSNRVLGSKFGSETTTLGQANLPPHNHGVSVAINGTTAPGNNPVPTGNVPALSTSASIYGPTPNAVMGAGMATVTQQNVGTGQAFNNMQPTLTLRYCVALQGLYPSRN